MFQNNYAFKSLLIYFLTKPGNLLIKFTFAALTTWGFAQVSNKDMAIFKECTDLRARVQETSMREMNVIFENS